jgi:hypothetical protein
MATTATQEIPTQGIMITGHVPGWVRKALIWLGITTAGSTATVVVTAARWINLPPQVEANTGDIRELQRGQTFLVCVADAQVDHIDPAACKSVPHGPAPR